MAKVKITWTKSAIGYSEDQKMTIKMLGLKRLNRSVVREDSPVLRGMILKVRHLVSLEEVPDEAE